MRKIERSDVKNLHEYELIREELARDLGAE